MKPKELTIRGLILGSLITTIFTAANVYLGLKVGLTFRIVHSGGGNFDGHPEFCEGLVDPRKQHRPNRGVCRRYTFSDHLCSPRNGYRRLVDGISFLAIVSNLFERWRAWSVVHNPAQTRPRYQQKEVQ